MLTLNNILKITGGRLSGLSDYAAIKGVSIDSRTLKRGDLFIAIKGRNFDGHTFIKKALNKRASAIVVSNSKGSIKSDVPIICVKDTIKALGQIAQAYRQCFSMPVVAITGSNGKTTTKEMVAAVLGSRFKVLKNPATENNFIGVSLALLRLRKSHDVAILELGTNHPGEIRWLTQITKPDVSILTNIGDSHLAFLKSRSGVFKEKFDIVKNMPKDGCVIFNKDDLFLNRISSKNIPHRLIDFGVKHDSSYRATHVATRKNACLEFVINGRKAFTLKTVVLDDVYNALAAICCGRLFKIDYNAIQQAIARFRFIKGRQSLEKSAGVWIINDTYNSNPSSFGSALKSLSALKNKGRKIIICADMLELGSKSKMLHLKVGGCIAHFKPDLVLAVGHDSKFIIQGIRKKDKRLDVHYCPSLSIANQRLKKYIKKGDAVLVKGSRGMRMERTVAFLRNEMEAV